MKGEVSKCWKSARSLSEQGGGYGTSNWQQPGATISCLMPSPTLWGQATGMKKLLPEYIISWRMTLPPGEATKPTTHFGRSSHSPPFLLLGLSRQKGAMESRDKEKPKQYGFLFWTWCVTCKGATEDETCVS